MLHPPPSRAGEWREGRQVVVICSSCGTENRDGATFCMECATPLAVACPACGTVNAPTAKFCMECATPLAPKVAARDDAGAVSGALDGAATAGGARDAATGGGQPAAERRVVSVLFADLVGFTTYSEGRDAEEVRETLTRYFELAGRVIGQHGGTVEKFIGDAVMAVWGAPVAREDDAERAVRAALQLVDAIPSLGPTIQARAGVLTGEAAVTIGATNQGMVAGDIVNTAARLQAAAAPGTVLVGEATQRAASGAINFEAAGEQLMKGKAAPVAAWRAVRVVARRGGRGRSETLEAPFVGREEELQQLKEQFATTVRERRPRLVSIVGPAGIGKSRLAWEFLKYLDGLVDRVWWHAGRSPAYGDGITFWALGEMVRARCSLAEGDDELTTRARVAETVAAHVPDPAEARWVEAAVLALLGIDAEVDPDELFAAWRTFFERLAAEAPVVMVFEDLHHADAGLLDFIDHVLEWSRGVPILVVTLARPELLERRPDWGVGKRAFISIHLEPLPQAAMRELLAGLVPGLPENAVAAIVARADGMPLYAVETVRMLLAQGRLVREAETYRPARELGDLAIPETLTALIAARLDGLDPVDRGLLADAAVLGQTFSVPGLVALAGIDEPDLAPRLRGLVRRELLVAADPRSPERGQYAFVQGLIREVAYNTMARRERKTRHLAAAAYFENLGTDEVAAAIAVHYQSALRLAGDASEAADLAARARLALVRAAERASGLGSNEQAVDPLEEALEVADDPADRAHLHELARASAAAALDDAAVARHAEGAVAERRRTDDRVAIARAIARHANVTSVILSDPATSLAMLQAAWEEFADLEETAVGIDLMMGLASALRWTNDFEGGLAWTERLLPIAERLGLLDGVARGLASRGVLLGFTGRPREGMILLRGAHQLALAHDLREPELRGRTLLTFYEQWGEPAAGLALAREGLQIGRRLGSRRYGFSMVGNAIICAIRVGEWDAAARLLDEWLAVATSSHQRAELYLDRAILDALRGEDGSGDIGEARRLLTEGGVTDPQWEAYLRLSEAWGAFASGNRGEAARLAAEAIQATAYFAPLAWPLVIRSTLWSGDTTAAARAVDRLAASGFTGRALDADLVAARAGVAALDRRGADALAGYREALRGYRSLGLIFDEAAALVDVATLLPPAELALPEVATLLAPVRETLGRLGATPFIARLDSAATASSTASSGG
jgi:class 3 adenylate cyclase